MEANQCDIFFCFLIATGNAAAMLNNTWTEMY